MKTVGRILPRITMPSRATSFHIEADLEAVKNTLGKLKDIKLDVNSDFTSINSLFGSLGSIPLMTGMLMPGALVMRTRCELLSLHSTIKLVSKKAHISYRSDYQNVGIGRVSLAKEPAFYGCVFKHDGKKKDIFAIAAATCFAETRKNPNAAQQTMVAGIWRVTKPISFSIIVQKAELMNANSIIRQSLLPKYKFFRGDHRKDEASQLVTEFFAELYSQTVEQGEEYKYVLGACFATSLFLQGLDSLVYSSIATQGLMPNIAILPEVVDTSLELIKVRAIDMRKVGLYSYSEHNAYIASPLNGRWFKDEEEFAWCPHTSANSVRPLRS